MSVHKPPPPKPPIVARRPTTREAHGLAWRDDYAWLRAENWREVLRDPSVLPADIRAALEDENAYAEAVMAPTRALQKQLVREMRTRLKEDDSDVPQRHGPFLYYSRFRAGGQHRLYCRRPREGGRETALVDGDKRAEGKAFFQLGVTRHSPDHAFVAFSADETGSELATIRIVDLNTGLDLVDRIENASGSIVWGQDSRSLLYVALDDHHRPWRVMRHQLGASAEEDAVVFEEADPAWFLSIQSTRLGRRAIVSVHGHDASEDHVVDLADLSSPPRLLAARRSGHRYQTMDHGDRFYILTNSDGARDFRIVTAPVVAPEEENWQVFVPHREGRLIEDATLFRDHLVLLTRGESRPSFLVFDLRDGSSHEIGFEAQTYVLRFEIVYEFDASLFRFAYSSLNCSQEIYDYDMAGRQRMLRKKQETPADFDASDYVAKLVFISALDGERVPVSLLYKRETPLDGSAPALIYGYGAYGHIVDAAFSTNRFSLVDRGFVYAIAHVRGGADMGWRWYEQGKLANKPNTFSDFIAATRALVAMGYAHPRRVIAHGSSAGGMLMGVVANEAPELYAGIIADVPFVDVLNTMLDETLPLTPPEWREWGDPIRDVEVFRAIRAYSPYDNVRAQRYPAILALAGLADPRVTYWEPAKWVARLRERMTGGGPILLVANMGAGHAGAPGRFDRLEDVARSYAFALLCAQGSFDGLRNEAGADMGQAPALRQPSEVEVP